jgi:hypothetical protein
MEAGAMAGCATYLVVRMVENCLESPHPNHVANVIDFSPVRHDCTLCRSSQENAHAKILYVL